MLLEQWREFVAALRFLTTIPVPGTTQLFKPEELGERMIVGAAYFPLVGVLLGLLLWGCLALMARFIPPLVLAALLVIALILLTGGLHLDGLMDTCDGLFGGRTRDRKLEIMRDSRVGSFGVLGGVSLLLLKFVCLASPPVHALPSALLIALPASRWCMTLALQRFPSARSSGLGNLFRQAVTLPHLFIAACIALFVVVAVAQVIGFAALLLVTGLTFGLAFWITHELNGLTGDSYGSIAEVTETFILLLLVILHFGA